MNPRLPGELAPPLHLLEPWPVGTLLLLAFLCALLAFSIWRRRRHRNVEPRHRSKPLPAPTKAAFEARIDELRNRHLTARTHRLGLDELVALLRQRWQGKGRSSLSRRTARELQAEGGDQALIRLFVHLADLRFGRREPEAEDLRQACELAVAQDRLLSGGRR